MRLLKFCEISSREGCDENGTTLGFIGCVTQPPEGSCGDSLHMSDKVVAMLDYPGSEIGVYQSAAEAKDAVLKKVQEGMPHIRSINWDRYGYFVRDDKGVVMGMINYRNGIYLLYSSISIKNAYTREFATEQEARIKITEEYDSHINNK